MSGYDAYLSFANWMREQLDGKMTVVIEKTEDLQTPYLVIQDGPDQIDGWLSSRMIQGWVVVSRENDRPLVDTLGRAVAMVQGISQDPGHLTKYSYETDPPTVKGTFIPYLTEISPIMPRDNDLKVLRQVVTWVLKSNCS